MKKNKIRAIFYNEEESFKIIDENYYKQIGIVTFFTKNYLQSLSFLESRNIHIVIINVNKAISHYSLNLIKYLSQSEYKKIPIILTGVKVTSDQKKIAMQLGVSLVVDLPIAKDTFIKQIKLLLTLPVRQHERLIPYSIVRYEFEINHISYTGSVYDVSMSGLKVGLDKIIEINKLIEIRLYLSTIHAPIKIVCQVRRLSLCKRQEKSWLFYLGLQFVKFIDSAQSQLQHFLEEDQGLKNRQHFYK